MPKRQSKRHRDQASFLQLDIKTAPCVPKIREAVEAWVAGGYKGVTPTTRTLLNYWFHTDHRAKDGSRFSYYPSSARPFKPWSTSMKWPRFAGTKTCSKATPPSRACACCRYDIFPRYCLKMATGTGKTKVLSLAVAWQYFNAVLEDAQHYAATSLLIAPNVIVFERLKSDFMGGRIFKTDPVIPRPWKSSGILIAMCAAIASAPARRARST
jgi:type III restriction enzyme